MRKIISLAMVLSMLLTSVAIAIPAGATGTKDSIDSVEAYYFKSAPTIDGYITEAEWGEKTFSVNKEDTATIDSSTPYYNCFYYWKNGTFDSNPNLSYDIWLRWDENYFYVGAKVNDPDGHSLKTGKDLTWNGDAIQFRVDPYGPNSASFGEYDPDVGTPWAEPKNMADFVTGYVQIAGGFFEAYENTNVVGLTAYSAPKYGNVNIAVAPAGTEYSVDTKNNITTYEMAIPWKYILHNNYILKTDLTPEQQAPDIMEYVDYNGSSIEGSAGGIGRNLGMSLVLFNAEKGESSYNSFLSWGSGVTKVQSTEAPKTENGSNRVTLSATAVDPAAATYTKLDPSVLEKINPGEKFDSVFYDYLTGNFSKDTPVSYEGISTLTYNNDYDRSYWGSDEYQGSIANVGGYYGNVLSYSKTIINGQEFYPEQTYIDTRDGDMAYKYPLSYTFEFDIRYTGNEVVADSYDPSIYNWFGGASGYDYMCGYFFKDNEFRLYETNHSGTEDIPVAKSNALKLEKDQWHNWKFQFDNNSCTARLIVDNVVIFNLYNRYFYYSNEEMQMDGTLLMFRMMNTQCQFDNVKIYNFVDPVPNWTDHSNDPTFAYTVDGIESEAVAGSTVTIEAAHEKYINNILYRFDQWQASLDSIEINNSNNCKALFVMPSSQVSITAKYFMVGDNDGDGILSPLDLYSMKVMLVNEEFSKVFDTCEDNKLDMIDLYYMKVMMFKD